LTGFGPGAVLQNGSRITVNLGEGQSFEINYHSVENILIAPGVINELTIDDISVLEGDSGTTIFEFTVSLSGLSSVPVKVDFATADDTARAGTDYQAGSGTLTFAAGITSQTIQVAVVGDTDVEADEIFFVNLSNPDNAIIADNRAMGIIINDDTLAPTLSVDDMSVVEGDQGTVNALFIVSLSSPSTAPVTVDFATADDTALAGLDYQAVSGTLNFAPGVTSQAIQVAVLGDTDVELDETFFVNLAQPVNAIITDSQGMGIIINDDVLAPSLSINNISVVEDDQGAVNAVFTVNLSSPSLAPVTVDFATADDTAISGLDYAAISGTLIFAPGETTKMIQIPVVGDTVVEPDEMFFVNLSSPSHALIADGQAEGTIINDDVFVPTLSIDDVSVFEGDEGTIKAVFTINLSNPSSVEVTIDYATADDTATLDLDYQAVSGTLTISPGAASRTIEVPIIGDTDVELDETFFINLTNPSNVIVADGQAVGTIINDDIEIMPPEITVLLGEEEIIDGQDAPTIDFGTVVEGQYESHLSFLVRNDGGETLTLGDIVLPAGYSLSEGLVASLEAGEFDTFTVQLDTIEVGVKSGEISFTHNDTDENPFNFAISGAVLGPEITLFAEGEEISDGQTGVVNFGSVLVDKGGSDLTFTVRNDGSYELLLDGIVLPDGFSFGADSLVASLACGESDTFSVVMASDTVATHAGPIIITSNDSDEGTFEIPLGGVVWDIISIRAKKTAIQFADTEGRLTNVMLKGPGAVEVQSSVYALPTVALTDTTVKSKLVVKGAHVKAESTLYDIITNGSLKLIKGKKTDLQGSINMAGSLNKLVLDDIYANSGVITAQASKGLKVRADDVADDVTFDIADRIKSYKTSTLAGGSLAADSIKALKVRFGAMGADVTSRIGEIESIVARRAIEGDIISNTFIEKVISKTGGLAPDVTIMALEGDIRTATFAGDIAGNIMAEGQITRLSSRKGAFTGVARAHDRIGTVRFENIEGAIISSFGDISAVLSKDSIVDSFILAGYDIGSDGQLGGPVEDALNMEGATITSIMTARTGNFNGSFALAGVQPQFDVDTGQWGPAPEEQRVTADFGEIISVRLGRVWEGDATDPYGLFAATNIRDVKIAEILSGSGAPDFQIWP